MVVPVIIIASCIYIVTILVKVVLIIYYSLLLKVVKVTVAISIIVCNSSLQ